MHKPQTILAIDVGGTFTRAALIRGPGKILSKIITRTLRDGAQSLTQTVLRLKQQLESEAGLSTSGIAVALACVVEPRTGIVEKNLKLGFQTKVNFQDMLHAATGLPAIVRTELSMATLGEIVGANQGSYHNLVVLTVGTGLGAGVIIQGHLYFGSVGCAGEIGHIPVAHSSTARLCSCGRLGCLEAYAASYSVTQMVGAGPWCTPEEAVTAARQGDRKAMHAIQRTGRYIGLAASICVNAYDPELIILRGGFVRAIWSLISEQVHKVLEVSSVRQEAAIRLSNLAEDGVFLGLQTEWVNSTKLNPS